MNPKAELTEKLNIPSSENKTQIDDENENQQPSRLVLFILDAIENFEYKYYSIAGCLYAFIISAILAFLLIMREKHFPQLPFLEMFFVPILVTFSINFKLISTSNILPYFTDASLNWKAKLAAISFIVSLVAFVAAITKCDSRIVIFIYLSCWPLNILYERVFYSKPIQIDLVLPFLGVFMGCSLSTGALQILTDEQDKLQAQGLLYAFIGGLSLTLCGGILRRLKKENIFTISHILSLLSIIFIPLFFPLQGSLQSPGLNEWFFFLIISAILLWVIPIFARAFAVENTTIVVSQLSWTLPIYQGLSFILKGKNGMILLAQLPFLLSIVGSGITAGCSLMVMQHQLRWNDQTKTVLQRENIELEKPLEVELENLQNAK